MPRLLNLILSGAIFAVAIVRFASPARFILWGSLVIAAVIILCVLRLRTTVAPRRDYWLLTLPILYILGLFGTLSAVSSLALKLVLSLAGSGVFYYYQTNFPKARPVLDEEFFTLTTALFVFVSVWSLNFFFRLPWWQVSILMFTTSFFLVLQAFYKMPVPLPGVWSFVCALILLEIVTAVLYWPVNFMTSAVISFAGFYLCYIFFQLYYMRLLTKKRVYFHLSIIFALIFGSLITSAWTV